MSENTKVYTEKDIKIISLAEAVRKRPGMYFGSEEIAGNHLAFELIANAIDQCLAGKATHIKVKIHSRTISVEDDGEGFPFSKPALSKDLNNLGEQYFIHRVDKPTADGHAPHIHLGFGGLGLAIVNAACEKIDVTSVNNGKTWQQTFGHGKIISPATVVDSNLTKGTRITATLDDAVFQPNCFDMALLRKEVFETCHLFPNLSIGLNKERFAPEKGLLDLAVLYSYQNSQTQFHYHGYEDGVEIHVAFVSHNYCQADKTTFHSWANGRRTNSGGTHVDGLKSALTTHQLTPNTAMISVLFHEPKYAHPTRDKLVSPLAQQVVERVMTKAIAEWQTNR